MASLTPARSVGLENMVGSLEKGKQADVAIFDRNFDVIETYLKGKRVYPEEE